MDKILYIYLLLSECALNCDVCTSAGTCSPDGCVDGYSYDERDSRSAYCNLGTEYIAKQTNV